MTGRGGASLRVAVLQATSRPGDPEANLATVAAWAAEARGRGARLLVTPELFVPGYDPARVAAADGAAHRAGLGAIAAEHGICLVASTVEHADSVPGTGPGPEGRYISASLFDETGRELTRYRKSHLFGPVERAHVAPGREAPEVVEVHGVRVARGIELLCVPTAVPLRASHGPAAHTFDVRVVPTLVIPTRAIESQVFIAYADQAEPSFAGLSTIADPFGRSVSASTASGELVVADVELGVLARARAEVDYLSLIRERAGLARVLPPARENAGLPTT